MKLLVLSDVHNEFSVLPHPKTDADMVILAGDIDTKGRGISWASQFEQPVLYVAGNHEYYGKQVESIQAKLQDFST